MTANHDLSLRKALAYTDCSRNTYYYNKKKGPRNTRQQQHQQQQQQHHLIQTVLEKKIEEIILQRPSYGTRRMAAMLTRIMGKFTIRYFDSINDGATSRLLGVHSSIC
jgi:hypothetical protein